MNVDFVLNYIKDIFPDLYNILYGIKDYLLIIAIAIIIFYVVTAIILNKFNKLKYGKGSIMAFLPSFNVYLIGKLLLGSFFGLILFIGQFLGGSITLSLNEPNKTYTLIPDEYKMYYNLAYAALVFLLLIICIFRFISYKKSHTFEKIDSKKNKISSKSAEVKPEEKEINDLEITVLGTINANSSAVLNTNSKSKDEPGIL